MDYDSVDRFDTSVEDLLRLIAGMFFLISGTCLVLILAVVVLVFTAM